MNYYLLTLTVAPALDTGLGGGGGVEAFGADGVGGGLDGAAGLGVAGAEGGGGGGALSAAFGLGAGGGEAAAAFGFAEPSPKIKIFLCKNYTKLLIRKHHYRYNKLIPVKKKKNFYSIT